MITERVSNGQRGPDVFFATMETDKVNKDFELDFSAQEHDPLRPSCVLPAVTPVSPGVDASADVATASGHSL